MNRIERSQIVAETRLGMTGFIFLFILLPSSFMPESTVVFWLIVNSIVALIILVIQFVLWKKYKYDVVRFNSLQVYLMLVGIVFFAVVPLMKLLVGTVYFWMLFVTTLVFVIVSHVLRKRTATSFVNKNHKKLVIIASVYMMLLCVVGGILVGIMRIKETTENTSVSILGYLVGLLFILLAPMFLLKKEEVEQLK